MVISVLPQTVGKSERHVILNKESSKSPNLGNSQFWFVKSKERLGEIACLQPRGSLIQFVAQKNKTENLPEFSQIPCGL
jgi:hypothetical protein